MLLARGCGWWGGRYVRLRLIFFARPRDEAQLPKSVPDYESLGAAWVTLQVGGTRLPARSLLQHGGIACRASCRATLLKGAARVRRRTSPPSDSAGPSPPNGMALLSFLVCLLALLLPVRLSLRTPGLQLGLQVSLRC